MRQLRSNLNRLPLQRMLKQMYPVYKIDWRMPHLISDMTLLFPGFKLQLKANL